MARQYKDRWPRVSGINGPGYDTEPRDGFDNSIEFTFDYSGLDASTRQVKKELSDLAYQFYKISNQLQTNGKGFIYPTKKIENVRTLSTLKLSTKMFGSTEQLESDILAIAGIAADEGKKTIKKYIGGRIETGRMKGSVYGRVYKRKGYIVARAGWLDLWYKYFGFQENGTKRVSPMRSMLRSYLELSPEIIKTMNYYFRNYATRSNKSSGE